MLINGSCHCGNITFRLDWTPEPLEIPARACTCSFCLKRGGVWTSCPTGALEIRVRDLKLVSRYTFGTRTAEFQVCAQCGAVPVVTSLINDHLYAVVSVNAFDMWMHRCCGTRRQPSMERAKRPVLSAGHATGYRK